MSNELYHHGILGMKWGVRRYQNEDGSYTSAGKARRSEQHKSSWSERRSEKKQAKAAAKAEQLKKHKGPDNAYYEKMNKKADRGDKLRAKGQTITTNQRNAFLATMAVNAVAVQAAKSMGNKNYVMRYGNVPLGTVNRNTVMTGARIANAMIVGKTMYNNNAIRTSRQRQYSTANKYWAG